MDQNGKKLISAVLACGWPPNKSYKWADTKILMDYGTKSFEKKNITQENIKLEAIPVTKGQKESIPVKVAEEQIELLLNNKEKVEVKYECKEELQAPVSEGFIVGNVKYYIDHKLYKEVPICTIGEVEKINYTFCLKKIVSLFLGK